MVPERVDMDVAGASIRHPDLFGVLAAVVTTLVLAAVLVLMRAARRLAPGRTWPSLPSWYPFRPKFRVDIFYPFHAKPDVVRIKVAEVYSDGKRGQVKVFDPRFTSLEKTFGRPHLVMAGAMLQDGTRADVLRSLAPWREKTLRELGEYELPSANLRAEFVRLR